MIRVQRGDLTLVVESNEEAGWDGYWSGVWSDGRWEPETYAALEALDPTVLIDVGAWIGPITLWAAARGWRVEAIEPDPVAVAALRANVAHNGLGDRVSVHHAAVTLDGLPTHIAPGDHGGFGESLSMIAHAGHPVDSVTVPQLITMHTSSEDHVAVKMDIEGYEAILLPVVAPWLARRRIALNVSFHGAFDETWFDDYEHVRWDVPGPFGTVTAW